MPPNSRGEGVSFKVHFVNSCFKNNRSYDLGCKGSKYVNEPHWGPNFIDNMKYKYFLLEFLEFTELYKYHVCRHVVLLLNESPN